MPFQGRVRPLTSQTTLPQLRDSSSTYRRRSNVCFSVSGSLNRAKPRERNPLDAKVRELEAKVARLEKELHTARTILDVQGKVAGLLGFNLNDGKDC